MNIKDRIENIEERTLEVARRLAEIHNEHEELYTELKFLLDARNCLHISWDRNPETNQNTCLNCGWKEEYYD